MIRQWTTCSRRSAAGLTLIEVVAAIAIIGTILVGIVLAQSRHTRQIARTQQIDAAIEAADAQIQRWWSSTDGVPMDERGMVEGASLRWVSRIVASDSLERLEAQVVRIDFHATAGLAGEIDGARGEPLFSVDLVVPAPDEDEESAREGSPDTRPRRESGGRDGQRTPQQAFGARGVGAAMEDRS